MFYIIKKKQIILFLLLILTVIGAFVFSAALKDENTEICLEFLNTLGYSSEKTPYEISDIVVPEGFGKVYENYNIIQKEAGFDLTPYRGLTIKRYSFHLSDKDFPIANILLSDGKICGGDILNPSLSGEMRPLIPKEKE